MALDPTTSKPHRVNRLVPTTPEEEQRRHDGERNKTERLKAKSEALHVRLPNVEELQMIHQFFIDDYSGGALRDATTMAATHQVIPTLQWSRGLLTQFSTLRQRSMIFCAHQQRNIHNKIFGGFLMRYGGGDSAWQCVCARCMADGRLARRCVGKRLSWLLPQLSCSRVAARSSLRLATSRLTIQSVWATRAMRFQCTRSTVFYPEIGSLLDLRSAVVYTEKNDMQGVRPFALSANCCLSCS